MPRRNGADVIMLATETKLSKPILDHYLSIPTPTDDEPNARTSYHVRSNISKHDFTTKRFFATAQATYNFIKRNGHPITDCSHVRYGCPQRIQ